MATEVNKYRVWCSTDSKYVEVWAEDEPTTCPENTGHIIDAEKTVIVETLSEDFPRSELDDNKIAVHPSYKPAVESGAQTYAIWTGAGDDLSQSPSGVGDGPLLHFDMQEQPGSPHTQQVVSIDVQFDPAYGRIWIHEGYLSFNDAGCGDYVSATIVASATPVQPFANKILYIEDNWIKYAIPGSPGNVATHGWGGSPIIIPRTFEKDGDWDYDGTNLTPNFTGTGGYKISDIERVANKFINKIPCRGNVPYFSMTSDETSWLPPGMFIRICAYNVSNTTWNAGVVMEIYREVTHNS